MIIIRTSKNYNISNCFLFCQHLRMPQMVFSRLDILSVDAALRLCLSVLRPSINSGRTLSVNERVRKSWARFFTSFRIVIESWVKRRTKRRKSLAYGETECINCFAEVSEKLPKTTPETSDYADYFRCPIVILICVIGFLIFSRMELLFVVSLRDPEE